MSTWRFGRRSSSGAEPGEVLGVAGEVGTDERRPRVGGDQGLERVQQPLMRGERRAANDHSGWASSSSRRSLWRSTGSKNAGGSAVWISTGIPSSPAAANTGAARASSGSISWPARSRKPSPSVFQTLSPRAPAAAERRSDSASSSPKPSPSGGPRPVELAEGDEAARVGAVEAVEVRLQLRVPAAVEVDRGLDRVPVAELQVLARPRPPRRGPASGEVARDPVAVGIEPAAEVGVEVDRAQSGAARPGCARAAACSPARTRRAAVGRARRADALRPVTVCMTSRGTITCSHTRTPVRAKP